MIALAEHAEGVLLPVRVQPGARHNAVLGEHAAALKVAVSAPAEAGRANAAVMELLAQLFGVRRSQISLVAGQTSRNKRFLVRGLQKDAARQRIAAVLRGNAKD